MKPLGRAREVWALVLTLGMAVASCATQVLTPDIRPPIPDPRPLASKEPDAPTQVRVQAAYGNLPLHFEANQGQSDA